MHLMSFLWGLLNSRDSTLQTVQEQGHGCDVPPGATTNYHVTCTEVTH